METSSGKVPPTPPAPPGQEDLHVQLSFPKNTVMKIAKRPFESSAAEP